MVECVFEITDSCFHTVFMFCFILFFWKHLDIRLVPSQCYFGIAFVSLVLIDIVMYGLI